MQNLNGSFEWMHCSVRRPLYEFLSQCLNRLYRVQSLRKIQDIIFFKDGYPNKWKNGVLSSPLCLRSKWGTDSPDQVAAKIAEFWSSFPPTHSFRRCWKLTTSPGGLLFFVLTLSGLEQILSNSSLLASSTDMSQDLPTWCSNSISWQRAQYRWQWLERAVRHFASTKQANLGSASASSPPCCPNHGSNRLSLHLPPQSLSTTLPQAHSIDQPYDVDYNSVLEEQRGLIAQIESLQNVYLTLSLKMSNLSTATLSPTGSIPPPTLLPLLTAQTGADFPHLEGQLRDLLESFHEFYRTQRILGGGSYSRSALLKVAFGVRATLILFS